MRCDINLSLFDQESKRQGSRVEIKNVLGVKFVEKAIEVEILRQSDLIEKGEAFGV